MHLPDSACSSDANCQDGTCYRSVCRKGGLPGDSCINGRCINGSCSNGRCPKSSIAEYCTQTSQCNNLTCETYIKMCLLSPNGGPCNTSGDCKQGGASCTNNVCSGLSDGTTCERPGSCTSGDCSARPGDLAITGDSLGFICYSGCVCSGSRLGPSKPVCVTADDCPTNQICLGPFGCSPCRGGTVFDSKAKNCVAPPTASMRARRRDIPLSHKSHCPATQTYCPGLGCVNVMEELQACGNCSTDCTAGLGLKRGASVGCLRGKCVTRTSC